MPEVDPFPELLRVRSTMVLQRSVFKSVKITYTLTDSARGKTPAASHGLVAVAYKYVER